jgi:hypothetical protein
LVPVPSEYVLDVMRWVLFHSPDEQGESSGRDAMRVEKLLAELDDLQRSLLVLIARSVGTDDQLRLSDAAAELGHAPSVVSDTVRDINLKSQWTKQVVTLRPETAVGVLGKRGKVSVLTMRPEIAGLVRDATRSSSVPGE